MALLHLLGFGLSVAGFTLCAVTGDWTAAIWSFATGCWVITSWLGRKGVRA